MTYDTSHDSQGYMLNVAESQVHAGPGGEVMAFSNKSNRLQDMLDELPLGVAPAGR
jgi:hypothetical protein